jgi:hypothetical protein
MKLKQGATKFQNIVQIIGTLSNTKEILALCIEKNMLFHGKGKRTRLSGKC